MNKKRIFAILAIVFIVSDIIYIGYLLGLTVFAFRNPSYTMTQLIIRFAFETAGGKWLLLSIVTYAILYFGSK